MEIFKNIFQTSLAFSKIYEVLQDDFLHVLGITENI